MAILCMIVADKEEGVCVHGVKKNLSTGLLLAYAVLSSYSLVTNSVLVKNVNQVTQTLETHNWV